MTLILNAYCATGRRLPRRSLDAAKLKPLELAALFRAAAAVASDAEAVVLGVNDLLKVAANKV